MRPSKQREISIAERRYNDYIKRKRKKEYLRTLSYKSLEQERYTKNNKFSLLDLIDSWIPANLKYLLSTSKSDFHYDKCTIVGTQKSGNFVVPKVFSLVKEPKDTYEFLQLVLGALITQEYKKVNIDYAKCEILELEAQVLLDIIIKEVIQYYNRCTSRSNGFQRVSEINGKNMAKEEIRKILFSVGSPVIHSKAKIPFKDIIPYNLCIHDRESTRDPIRLLEQKDLDTTKLVDYVIESLTRLSIHLAPDKLDDLSTVIGEILINAEEHSTTQHRFSIGYFHESNINKNHFGVFRLVILNFGKTIYEKFKDPECPNKDIVAKMEKLSERYTKQKFFSFGKFEEETLWTLYALQEGVSSVASDMYRKRGNGSIQFIESFFNIKGNIADDNVSQMTILSGHTKITFDGKYQIVPKSVDGEKYKYMTFNKTGNIENKPDEKYVNFVSNYFPGTMIIAKILFNQDDTV